MKDLGERLCNLIQRAVHTDDPDLALRSIAVLQRDLGAFERAQVARARRRGASFGDIAEALGISRQAAHRRYRDVGDTDAAEAEEADDGRILVTSEARAVVRHAREEASALGAAAVGTEHLLLGALRVGQGHAVAALRQLGVDLAAARANAQVTLVNGSRDGVPEGPRGISTQARAVFEQSLRDAVRRGDGYIGIEHLLLAALGDEESGAHRTLEALRVDVRALLAKL